MFRGKKGFIGSIVDITKGIVIGFILGAFIVYLGAKGIINMPFL